MGREKMIKPGSCGMLNGLEIEAFQMSDMSMVCVGEHTAEKKVTDQTLIGKNIFACGLSRYTAIRQPTLFALLASGAL
jgi:hypothetical protein